jgi:hypothetical protein
VKFRFRWPPWVHEDSDEVRQAEERLRKAESDDKKIDHQTMRVDQLKAAVEDNFAADIRRALGQGR